MTIRNRVKYFVKNWIASMTVCLSLCQPHGLDYHYTIMQECFTKSACPDHMHFSYHKEIWGWAEIRVGGGVKKVRKLVQKSLNELKEKPIFYVNYKQLFMPLSPLWLVNNTCLYHLNKAYLSLISLSPQTCYVVSHGDIWKVFARGRGSWERNKKFQCTH